MNQMKYTQFFISYLRMLFSPEKWNEREKKKICSFLFIMFVIACIFHKLWLLNVCWNFIRVAGSNYSYIPHFICGRSKKKSANVVAIICGARIIILYEIVENNNHRFNYFQNRLLLILYFGSIPALHNRWLFTVFCCYLIKLWCFNIREFHKVKP